MSTATKTVRLSTQRLAAASPVLERLGIDPRSALEMFLAAVASRKAIPFAIALPESEIAAEEYGLTVEALGTAADKIAAEVATAETVEFKPGMLTRENRTHKKVSGRRR